MSARPADLHFDPAGAARCRASAIPPHEDEGAEGRDALVTRANILRAAAWRLRRFPQELVDAALSAADDALRREGNPEAVLCSKALPRPIRADFVAACAILVGLGHVRGDNETFYRAGYVVLRSSEQAKRAGRKRGADALNLLIQAYLDELPTVSPAELWREFGRRTEDGDEILVEFDEEGEILTYARQPGGKLASIPFDAFRRRVQRLR